MYSVYGIEYNHKIIYIGYKDNNNKEDYIKYTVNLLFKNNGTYWKEIADNKQLTEDNIIIFKDNIEEEQIVNVCEELSYIILPKYNEIRGNKDGIYYVFPDDCRPKEMEGINKTLNSGENVAIYGEDKDKELSLNEQLLLLS